MSFLMKSGHLMNRMLLTPSRLRSWDNPLAFLSLSLARRLRVGFFGSPSTSLSSSPSSLTSYHSPQIFPLSFTYFFIMSFLSSSSISSYFSNDFRYIP